VWRPWAPSQQPGSSVAGLLARRSLGFQLVVGGCLAESQSAWTRVNEALGQRCRVCAGQFLQFAGCWLLAGAVAVDCFLRKLVVAGVRVVGFGKFLRIRRRAHIKSDLPGAVVASGGDGADSRATTWSLGSEWCEAKSFYLTWRGDKVTHISMPNNNILVV
jgi:hypothetical protein